VHVVWMIVEILSVSMSNSLQAYCHCGLLVCLVGVKVLGCPYLWHWFH
jgi:hypothetical protein